MNKTRSASCSMAPDSRRSDSCGRWSVRPSGARLSCDSAMIGQLSSLARPLSERGDRRHFLLPALEPAASRHQLEVVDDDQVEAVLRLQPPRLGPHLEHADRRRVVDEHPRLGERAERMRQAAVVLLVQIAGAEAVGVDARLGREHAHEQLLLRHLEAEEADGHRRVRADVLRHVEHEARLPHRRAGGDHDQVAGVETRGHLVEIGETAGDAGDRALGLLQLLDGGEAALHQVAERHEPFADAILGDREDGALRLVEQQLRLLLGLVGLGQDLVRGMNQAPQRRFFFDDPRVVGDVRGPRHAVGQRRDVRRTAALVELAGARQLFLQGDEVDRLAALAERHHLVEDPAVRVAEEIARVDQLRRVVERLVMDQDRAEDRFLRVEIVGKRAFRSRSDVRHRCRGWSSNSKRKTGDRKEPIARLPFLVCRGMTPDAG